MPDIDSLVDELDNSGKETFWQGKASPETVDRLEGLLKARFPNSFRRFLLRCGGGGLVGREISGIEENNASVDYRGTVLGDTLRCRTEFELPAHLVVIYFTDEYVVWCLDTANMTQRMECAVVSFDVYSKRVTHLAATFDEFFADYVRFSRE